MSVDIAAGVAHKWLVNRLPLKTWKCGLGASYVVSSILAESELFLRRAFATSSRLEAQMMPGLSKTHRFHFLGRIFELPAGSGAFDNRPVSSYSAVFLRRRQISCRN
jgi:hypothetical protein